MEILGLGIGQLAEFMNPKVASKSQIVQHAVDRLNKISGATEPSFLQELLLVKDESGLTILSDISNVVEECKNIINGK